MGSEFTLTDGEEEEEGKDEDEVVADDGGGGTNNDHVGVDDIVGLVDSMHRHGLSLIHTTTCPLN